MKDKIQRPIVSKGSPLVPALSALVLIGFCVNGVPVALEALKTGQTYSIAVVFGDGTKVLKDVSPISYWLNLGLVMIGFSTGIVVGIAMLVGIVVDQKRKSKGRMKDNGAASLGDKK